MDPISEFFHETHERTKGVVSYYQERGQNIFRLEVGLAISLLALLLGFFYYLSKRIIRPILEGGLAASEVAAGNLTTNMASGAE